jgi:hypothetical protein
MHNNLDDVATAIHLSRQVIKNIRQNLFWAFGYNVLGIPIAAGICTYLAVPCCRPCLRRRDVPEFGLCRDHALRLKGYRKTPGFGEQTDYVASILCERRHFLSPTKKIYIIREGERTMKKLLK